jgi:hypothetical protein
MKDIFDVRHLFFEAVLGADTWTQLSFALLFTVSSYLTWLVTIGFELQYSRSVKMCKVKRLLVEILNGVKTTKLSDVSFSVVTDKIHFYFHIDIITHNTTPVNSD